LLHDPNVNSPANNEAARLYKENRREYEKKVTAVVQESWVEDEGDEVEDNVKDSENGGMNTVSSWWNRVLINNYYLVRMQFSFHLRRVVLLSKFLAYVLTYLLTQCWLWLITPRLSYDLRYLFGVFFSV